MTRTIAALYDDLGSAQRAEQALLDYGVPRGQVSIIRQDTAGAGSQGGFVDALSNLYVPDEDRHFYAEGIHRGGYLLAAEVDESDIPHVARIMEEYEAVDLDQREAEYRSSGWTYHEGLRTRAAPAAARASAGEEVIPVAEEQLRVGKREVDRGTLRVRSYVREVPVEEQVRLRDEHVDVERRPVDRPLTGDEDVFQERTIEVAEHDEEAVIGKEARVTEEVVVRKDVDERVETVRDTVRRTEVDVDDAERGAANRNR